MTYFLFVNSKLNELLSGISDKKKTTGKKEKLKPIIDRFQYMENIEELRTMGVGENDTQLLLIGKSKAESWAE